jgi:predicted CXXCH cytochrome family protein
MKTSLRNRLRATAVALGGLCLLIAALYLWQAAPVQAQPNGQDEPPNLGADYVGSSTCSMCHEQDETWHWTAHARMVKPPVEETILGDLASAPVIAWPDGDTRALSADDITYVLGERYMQRYVSVVEDEDGTTHYYVLPVQWNIPQNEDQTGTWTDYHIGDWTEPARDWRVACAGCHSTGLDGETAAEETDFAFLEDFKPGNVELNIGCEACHGPGSVHLTGPSPESIVHTPDAAICGQCHVQGQSPDGDHGYPVGYQPGLALDESVFTLAAEDNESVWWPTGHAKTYDQYGEWITSDHASSMAMMPECARCHGTMPGGIGTAADEETSEQTAWNGITCVACHNPHPVEEDADTLPAMLQTGSYQLCVACHNSRTPEGDMMVIGDTIHYPVQEMFEGWKIVGAVEGVQSGHFQADDGPRCVDCHMPDTVQIGEYGLVGSHSMAPVLADGSGIQGDSCTVCHTDLSPDYIERFVQDTQTGVAERLKTARERLEKTPGAADWVVTVLDFVTNDGSMGVHNYAYTDALLNAAEVELGLTPLDPNASAAMVVAENPEDCEECHHEAFQKWQTSPHAMASTNEAFLQYFADQGRPNYCMSCHASGYNQATGDHAFEGVVCTTCHIMTNGTEHPPAPVAIADESKDCGRCHTGAHAPTYDEWLVSSHKAAGIDCVDCHTPHDNGLLLGNVNDTCGDCHREALVDKIHMGKDMTCVDCHMRRDVVENGVLVRTTGHTMAIDPGTCAECHGNTHMLSVREVNQFDDVDKIQELENQIDDLENDSDKDWNSGVIGGALGALILVFVLFLLVRLRSLL